MTQVGHENGLIELAVPRNSYFDPEFMSLALLELNLPNCLAEIVKIYPYFDPEFTSLALLEPNSRLFGRNGQK